VKFRQNDFYILTFKYHLLERGLTNYQLDNLLEMKVNTFINENKSTKTTKMLIKHKEVKFLANLVEWVESRENENFIFPKDCVTLSNEQLINFLIVLAMSPAVKSYLNYFSNNTTYDDRLTNERNFVMSQNYINQNGNI
jgi:hypothetical protein